MVYRNMRSTLWTCRRAVRGADPTEEAEEAAGGGNGSHVHRGPRRHAAAGSGHAGSTAARDDREAGGHAEAVQQEVFPRAAQSHGESFRSGGGHNLFVCLFTNLYRRLCVCVCVWKPWPQSHDPQNREVRQQRFAHFTELAIMSVQEIVDFAKQLPGFLELTREDQIALLKTSTIEVCHCLVFQYFVVQIK